MSTNPGRQVVSYALQAVCYAAFMAIVGYFATSPAYVHLPAGEALVKLSLQHAGAAQGSLPRAQRRGARQARAEHARGAPSARASARRWRSRSRWTASRCSPSSRRRPDCPSDGASTVYRRVAVPAGTHRFVARMKDSIAGGYGFVGEHSVDLKPGRVLVIDFDAKDGWVFRG